MQPDVEMVTKKTWQEFRDTGLFWWINSILHTFGWAICIELENGIITNSYPARVKFRGFDETTDVLSFESGEIDPETGHRYLGDIAISIQAAERQSLEAGHPLQNEMVLLITHAILHLIGYDHNTPDEKKAMWAKQQAVLDTLHVRINRISGDENFHD